MMPSMALTLAIACGGALRTATTPARVVAIGDIHADPASLRVVLQMAGLTGADGHWSGGTTTMVQTGDITDRGPDSHGVMAILRQLQEEAGKAGGRVIPLLGNHEVMNVIGDVRYVSAEDYASYGGEAARTEAFGPSGEDGRWLRKLDAVARVGRTIFLHGGLDANWAGFGTDGINAMVRAIMLVDGASRDVYGPDGPLWNRVYLLAEPPVACPELEKALTSLGADRMVIGHTTQESGRIASRCGGRLYGIDTGISAFYGNHYAALEIVADTVREIYPTAAP